ncbi:MAG: gamma-glutamyltransferase [Ktedonobacterales bacterium]|jgi:gamma-glutamyltranspeptidase/glutathione hydrolase|nr:MAG: gamma-glutamyltransferase [Ktedonobacterales bacterium]
MTEYPQHRPVTLATHGLVAAPHYLAAQAGLHLLKAGGNAIDAAIAANATLQVVYPQLCGLGGDLFALLYDARSRELYGLNASGRAPRAATIERYHALGHATMPDFGIHTVTVPGCADGWGQLAERFGRLGLARALAPAIAYATDGFPVGPGLHAALVRMDSLGHTHRSFREHFMPGGAIPPAGGVFRRPDLARTLRLIAERGPQAFYRGELADQIATFFASEGGLLAGDDLAAHTSEWVTPLSVRFGDLDVYELPPNTQGVTALQMLGIMDGLPLGADPLDVATAHLAVEAKKLAFADRDAYLTDAAHMRVDPAALIAPDYLASRRALITPDCAQPSVAPGSVNGDTIYLCAADEEGNAVSLIQSNYRGFGSGLVVDGTGIVLQNRGAYLSLDPDAANALAPGKRTLHTLIPSLALRDGLPAVVFGCMGGDGQPQTHLQVYTALAKFGLNIQAAIELPRWLDGVAALGTPERLWLESRFPSETSTALRALGHDVEIVGPWDSQMGHANGIVIDHTNGVLHGGSDPRAEGAAVGW